MKPMTIYPAPAIFDRNFMIMVPNRTKGPGVVAPYFFDTQEEAQSFLDSNATSYWWNSDN